MTIDALFVKGYQWTSGVMNSVCRCDVLSLTMDYAVVLYPGSWEPLIFDYPPRGYEIYNYRNCIGSVYTTHRNVIMIARYSRYGQFVSMMEINMPSTRYYILTAYIDA